jgi:hypothetical protein
VALAIIGISCSTYCIISTQYFSFESLRNDTFYEMDKRQPEPFDYAVTADVGLFKYKITEVFEYPWPPGGASAVGPTVGLVGSGSRKNRRQLQADGVATEAPVDTPAPTAGPSSQPSTAAPTGEPSGEPSFQPSTAAPSGGPSGEPSAQPSTGAPSGGPSSNPTLRPTTAAPIAPSPWPTGAPSFYPSISNPNNDIDVDVGVTKKYENGMDQFDSTFHKAQLGALLAPIFAGLGTVFGLIEFCCCEYRCSWLPTAIFLYLAFMFQTFTLFLFLSEDFW